MRQHSLYTLKKSVLVGQIQGTSCKVAKYNLLVLEYFIINSSDITSGVCLHFRSLIQRYMCAEERHSMIDVNYVLLWNGVKWEDTTED